MMRALPLLVLLGACSTAHPAFKTNCPPRLPIPAPAPSHPTRAQVAALEVRVELWAEKSETRGDACAEAVRERDNWIARFVK